MMKLYKTSIASLPISSCRECPNRVSRRFKHGKNKYYSEWVCGAIMRNTKLPPIGGKSETMPTFVFPSVAEAMSRNGWLAECPLEDYMSKGDTK